MSLFLPPRNPVPLLLLCLLFVPVGAFVVRNACGLCRIDIPSWPRAVFAVLLVGPVAFFVYDLSGYGVAVIVNEVPWREALPYKQWLRAPWDWKWEVMGRVPVVPLLPFVFSLCVAGILQVFLFHVPFRVGLIVFAVQWSANLVAFCALACVCNVALSVLGVPTQPLRLATASGPATASPGEGQPAESDKPEEKPPVIDENTDLKDINLEDLKHPLAKLKDKKDAEPVVRRLQPPPEAIEAPDDTTQGGGLTLSRRELLAQRDELNKYLEPLKAECAPLTERLPGPVQQFLDGGGWWLGIGVNAVLACLWGRETVGRVRQLLDRPRRVPASRGKRAMRPDAAAPLALAADAAPARFTIKGLPAHLRLVVLAPAGRETGDLTPDMVDTLLDWIRPGLGEAAERDAPKIEIWERQYSKDGFSTTFFFKFRPPDSSGRSCWVLLAGAISAGKETVHVGMALLADEASNLGQVRVVNEQWLDVLGVRNS